MQVKPKMKAMLSQEITERLMMTNIQKPKNDDGNTDQTIKEIFHKHRTSSFMISNFHSFSLI